MNEIKLQHAVQQRVLLCDGAMGTELQKADLEPGGCGEILNLEQPEKILSIHRAYVLAGADCLTTNTFGGSRIMLGRHGHDDKVDAIARTAVQLAREAFSAGPGYVLGDVGPLGGLLEPYGDISEAQARDAFGEQIAALIDAGVDAILIETQTSLEELGVAIAAAREAGAPAVIGSIAYDVTHAGDDLRTMMGVTPEDAARFMAQAGVDVLGVNCGSGVDAAWAARVVLRYRTLSDLPTLAQPNAGQPVLENLRTVYKQDPELMASGIQRLLDAGVAMVGGCCGTTPEHIGRFRQLIDRKDGGVG
ncbi:MAG: homocysteine S-methyltransferase family protein [Gemmatimonadales bacterium]|jgi:5-methyltetrahydrofolate--homocysteine methyltransferase